MDFVNAQQWEDNSKNKNYDPKDKGTSRPENFYLNCEIL